MSVPTDQMQTGLAGAVDKGITASGGEQTPDSELDEVKALTKMYTVAREFDKDIRKQYNKDRSYASGRAGKRWASNANIIGSFIDILVSFLYAQNPDVSVRPSPQAGGQPDKNMTLFAETLQIVVSRLWRDAKLKKTVRKMVRSALSVGSGWMKALVYSEQRRNPALEKQIHDVKDNLEQVQALKTMIGEDGPDKEAQITELKNVMTGLQAQIELFVKRGLCADFCRAEDMQVSLDIADTADYLDADWLSNDMYIVKSTLRTRFPRLTEEDCKSAAIYFQRQTGTTDKTSAAVLGDDVTASDGQFTKDGTGVGRSASNTVGGDKPVEFAKVIELWDHSDNLIKTLVDGIKKWPVEPYAPPQASTRFYPYFRLAFYEVDGLRHPQSLSMRLEQLQDEYASARSNYKLVRERSVPGTIFDSGNIAPEEASKINDSAQMEAIPIRLTVPGSKIVDSIVQKPVPRVDPALYETGPIKYDMEVMSGVQEAQQGAQSTAKTATEAQIQQSGFASRTGADRDTEEDMLTDFAQYTAELAVQALDVQYVQKMCGQSAFWPAGLSVEDILTMLDVEISAGSTGKPQTKADKETWATLMPLIMNAIPQIMQAEAAGNLPLAQGMRKLLGETLKRLDDRLDIDDILPPAEPAAPVLPGAGGVPAGPGIPAPGAPPVGNGTVNNPGAIPTPPPVAA